MKIQNRDLETMMMAAKAGGEIIKYYNKNRSKLEITYKSKHDLLTRADVETEKAILEIIKKRSPNDAILAEESGGEMVPAGRVWIIDPIDGTTNFAHGFRTYCISIALYEDGIPLVGLVNNAALGEYFYAVKGEGAYFNHKKIEVTTCKEPHEALIGTGFPYRDLEAIDQFISVMKVLMMETQGLRRPGSAAYDLCCVASGRYDGFYEYALSPWDVAAGAIIIREAGGIVTDWEGNDNWLLGRRFVAGNPDIHAYLLKTIKNNA